MPVGVATHLGRDRRPRRLHLRVPCRHHRHCTQPARWSAPRTSWSSNAAWRWPRPSRPTTRSRPTPRRLLADITAGGEVCKRALAPAHRPPARGADRRTRRRPGEGVPFAEAAVPEGEGVARLTIVVTCPDLGLRAQAPIDLPTADRSLPSTVASFPFQTGAEGSALNFEILVLHGKRPIQEARVIASVRATPARRDRVQVVPVPLSAQPEPAPDATRADLVVGREGRSRDQRRHGRRDPGRVGRGEGLCSTRSSSGHHAFSPATSRSCGAPDSRRRRSSSSSPGSGRSSIASWPTSTTPRRARCRCSSATTRRSSRSSSPTPVPRRRPKAKLCTHATRPPGAAAGPCPQGVDGRRVPVRVLGDAPHDRPHDRGAAAAGSGAAPARPAQPATGPLRRRQPRRQRPARGNADGGAPVPAPATGAAARPSASRWTG